MGSKAFPPPKLLLPTFTPPCLASSTLNTGISVRVCVEGEKVCRHDTSVQNYCLLEQRRPHDILYWHNPDVVGALQFKYTESIVSAASALHCTETALCQWTRPFSPLGTSATISPILPAQCNMSTTNTTLLNSGSNQDRRGGKPATNRLSCGMATTSQTFSVLVACGQLVCRYGLS
jgi:hypothetical protein